MTVEHDRSITRELVEFLWSAATHPEDVGAVQRLLLDHVAVVAWGSRLDAGRIMRLHATEDLDQGGPSLPVIGTDQRTSALAASMANSVAACAYEFDDTHTGASVHPGAVIFPAALAAWRLSACDAVTFVRAVIIGYEVMCRVGRAANGPAHRERHFHPTSTTGHFGAAAAAAYCFGLDTEEAVAALTLAGTMAGGSMQFLVEGAWTKQVHPAFAVQRGVQAAQLAGRGFPGVSDPIGGRRAFLVAQSTDPRPERLLEGLGDVPFEVHNTGIKPYPSCRNTQSPLDALLSVMEESDLRASEVAKVRFGLIGPGIKTVFEPASTKRRPTTLVEAQFSMPFVAAVALVDGEVTPAQFEASRFSDCEVLALADRVECVHDPELDRDYPAHWPAWVEVDTNDGRHLQGRVEDPKGDPANPLTRDELLAKFRVLASVAYTAAEQKVIEGAVEELDQGDALNTLVGVL
jgi:2-methylcitrate dehydratase PrpD